MRVSDSQMYGLSLARLREGRAEAARAQEAAMTGMRVQKPSDDPNAAAAAVREKARGYDSQTHQRNVDVGMMTLSSADDALNETSGVITRLRELAVMLSSDSMTAQDRAGAAHEVSALRNALRGLANTADANGHVFGGFATDTPPFDPSGAYVGDSGVRELEVAPGIRVATSVPGDEVFGAAGGTDIFAAVDALETALVADDVTAVRASLTSLEASDDQVISARSKIGAQMRGLEIARSAAERVTVQSAEAHAGLVEVDPAEAYMAFARANTALEAAVRIASQLPFPGLVAGR